MEEWNARPREMKEWNARPREMKERNATSREMMERNARPREIKEGNAGSNLDHNHTTLIHKTGSTISQETREGRANTGFPVDTVVSKTRDGVQELRFCAFVRFWCLEREKRVSNVPCFFSDSRGWPAVAHPKGEKGGISGSFCSFSLIQTSAVFLIKVEEFAH